MQPTERNQGSIEGVDILVWKSLSMHINVCLCVCMHTCVQCVWRMGLLLIDITVVHTPVHDRYVDTRLSLPKLLNRNLISSKRKVWNRKIFCTILFRGKYQKALLAHFCHGHARTIYVL